MGDNGIKYSDIPDSNDAVVMQKKVMDAKTENGEGKSLMDVCRGLRIDHKDMQDFIDQQNNERDLNNAIQNLFEGLKNLDKTDQKKLDEYAKLCALSVYKRLKFMENRCAEYQKRSDNFNVKTRTYRNPKIQKPLESETSDRETEFRKIDMANEVNSLLKEINGVNNRMTRDIDMRMSDLLGSILTPYGKKAELIKYKLLFYKPSQQIKVIKSNLESASIALKDELDGISDILSPYMEDTNWKINIDRTLNFKVPDSKIVFSNTVNKDDIESDYLDTYMNMIIRYLERITDSKSIKYYIVEDNKYDIHWVLIAVSVRRDKRKKK